MAFTQQQSQLFVFSTMMANNAADHVQTNAQPSIYMYHLEDKNTKNFLQVFV